VRPAGFLDIVISLINDILSDNSTPVDGRTKEENHGHRLAFLFLPNLDKLCTHVRLDVSIQTEVGPLAIIMLSTKDEKQRLYAEKSLMREFCYFPPRSRVSLHTLFHGVYLIATAGNE
jgi:hypothetical protein